MRYFTHLQEILQIQLHFNTSSPEEQTPLLVHISDTMAATKGDFQSYETHVVGNPESYRKNAELNELSSDHTGQAGRGHSDDSVDPDAVGDALNALENKKTVWYAYLTTRDFWIVLAIGYVPIGLFRIWEEI